MNRARMQGLDECCQIGRVECRRVRIGFSGRGVRMVKAPAIRHRTEGRLRNRAHLVAPRPQIRTAAVDEHDRRTASLLHPGELGTLDGHAADSPGILCRKSHGCRPNRCHHPPAPLQVPRAKIASCMPLVHATAATNDTAA